MTTRILAVIVVALALTSLSAQAPPPVSDAGSIAGVSVGATLEEARARLEPLGTAAGRDASDGGRREVWTLESTDYASVAVTTNGRGSVTWVTGFVRPGRERPFSAFGDLGRAVAHSDTRAVWDLRTERGRYRLILRGDGAKARVVTMWAVK